MKFLRRTAHVASIVVLVATTGFSQPPAPRPPESGQKQQAETGNERGVTSSNQGGSQTSGVNVTINNQPTATPSQKEPQQKPERCCDKASSNWWPIIAALLTALATGVIAVYTIRLWTVGDTQSKTLDATLAANKTIERAYVDMSHVQPGLMPQSAPPPEGPAWKDVRFQVAIFNHGRTPADILGLSLNIHSAGPLPTKPPYGPFRTLRVIVMPKQSIAIWQSENVPITVWNEIQQGTRAAWLVGYVDYKDRFGARHRGGYARRYIHIPLPSTQNNLVFTEEDGYNYDIEIDEQGNPKN